MNVQSQEDKTKTAQIITAKTDRAPVKLSDFLDEHAPQGEKIVAQMLAGHEFTLLRARPFASRFQGQEHAWFVVGVLTEDKTIFNTVLGGAAVIETLDALAKAGVDQPVTMTLIWNSGGVFDGYYTLI